MFVIYMSQGMIKFSYTRRGNWVSLQPGYADPSDSLWMVPGTYEGD